MMRKGQASITPNQIQGKKRKGLAGCHRDYKGKREACCKEREKKEGKSRDWAAWSKKEEHTDGFVWQDAKRNIKKVAQATFFMPVI